MSEQNQNNDNAQKQRRRGALLGQSAVAAGVATAVLLGGFGAFSLWNDSVAAGVNDNIATGTLAFDGVTPGEWTIVETDGVLDAGDEIDPATFKASPGDVIQYTADVAFTAEASDMLAELVVDEASYLINPALAPYVTVELSDEHGAAGPIEIDTQGGSQSIPVVVTVAFSDTIPDVTGQDLPSAVALDGLNFRLDQVAGS